MPELIPDRNIRRITVYTGATLFLMFATAILAGSTLLNRDIARGEELQTQVDEFLAIHELPGRIDVYWYDNRVFVYSPVMDDQLPDLMKIIDSADWIRDVDLRNTLITEDGSTPLIRARRPATRVLTPWNSTVTPFLYD